MRIVYKGNYIRMTCGEVGLVHFAFEMGILTYSKTCLKQPLKNKQNKGLKDKW